MPDVGLPPPDQSLWFLCACLYLADHVRLHIGREMVLTETLGREWTPLLPLQGYRLAGRAITLLHPFVPFLAAVRVGWLEREPFSPVRLQRTATLIRLHQRSLAPFRILSCINFVALFAIGPALTTVKGLLFAIEIELVIHVVAIIALAACLAAKRRALRIKWAQAAELIFECAVCPGFFANVCRRVSLARSRLRGDAVAFAIERGDPRARSTLAYGLESVLDDLADNGELGEDDEPTLLAYRDQLCACRTDV